MCDVKKKAYETKSTVHRMDPTMRKKKHSTDAKITMVQTTPIYNAKL